MVYQYSSLNVNQNNWLTFLLFSQQRFSHVLLAILRSLTMQQERRNDGQRGWTRMTDVSYKMPLLAPSSSTLITATVLRTALRLGVDRACISV